MEAPAGIGFDRAMPMLLTPKQACAELGIGEDTLRAMRQAGEIPYVNVGRGRKRETPRYELDDLVAWKESRKQRARPPQLPSGQKRRPAPNGYAVRDFLEALERRRKGKTKSGGD